MLHIVKACSEGIVASLQSEIKSSFNFIDLPVLEIDIAGRTAPFGNTIDPAFFIDATGRDFALVDFGGVSPGQADKCRLPSDTDTFADEGIIIFLFNLFFKALNQNPAFVFALISLPCLPPRGGKKQCKTTENEKMSSTEKDVGILVIEF